MCRKHSVRNMAAYIRRAFYILVVVALIASFCWLEPFYGTPSMQLFSDLHFPTLTHHNECCNTLIKTGIGFYAEDPVEVRQLGVYFKKVSRNAIASKPWTSKIYRHVVEVACNSHKTQGGIVIRIKEEHLVRMTYGGSNFRALFGTAIPLRQVCAYHDYFNGTYIIFCPPPVFGCIHVSIDILYVNFDGFKGHQVPLNARLWNNMLCPLPDDKCRLGHNVPTNQLPGVFRKLRRRVAAQNRFKWSEVNGTLRLSTYNSQINETSMLQPLTQSKLCSCLRRYKNIVLIGDSHMRYKFDLLAMLCRRTDTPPLPRKHDSSHTQNLRYIYVNYLANYTSVWKKHLQSLRLTSADVVFIQTGSWDLAFNKLRQVMNENLAQFRVGLKTIRDGLAFRRTPLYLITEPPFTDQRCRECHGQRGNKNNVAITALTASIVSAAIKLGIAVHDEFNLLLPRQSETVCGAHYLCRAVAQSGTVTGQAGMASVEVLMKCLCDC